MVDNGHAKPVVTLIVCTRNRASKLPVCLKYISELQCSFPWELIVVDNNSTDHTAEVAQAFLATFPTPSMYLLAKEPGNGAGRNAAIAVGGGEIFAFTDDDCYVDANFLEDMKRVFDDPNVGFMSGRILLFNPDDHRITINESIQTLFVPGHGSLCVGTVQGANMGFRRKALIDAGLFDPNFGAGRRYAGEDWELAIRVCAKGWSGGYFPSPTVHHHHGRKQPAAKSLLGYYHIGEGAIYAKCLLTPGLRYAGFTLLAKSMGRDLIKGLHPAHVWRVTIGMYQYVKDLVLGRLVPADKSISE